MKNRIEGLAEVNKDDTNHYILIQCTSSVFDHFYQQFGWVALFIGPLVRMAKIMFWNVSCYCGAKSLFNQFSWDTVGKFVDSSVYLFHHPSWTGPRHKLFSTKQGTELRTALLVYRDENDGISSFPAYLSSLRETLSGPQALFAFILFMLSTTLACDMKMFIMQGETQLKWILLLAWLQTGRSFANLTPTVEKYALRICSFL